METTPIYSITPFSLLDYPDMTACILWFAGCNMRCLYCYNPDIVNGKGKFTYKDALHFLDRRGKLLDGVVLSGGECTMHHHLVEFLTELKSRGYSVKIDTNGSNPLLLEKLIQKGLVDYMALDYKALPTTFENITGSRLYDKFTQTLTLLLDRKFKFEVRTTVHSDLICAADLQKMVAFLDDQNYSGNYYIQRFVNDTRTLGNLGPSLITYDTKDFSLSDIQVIFRK